MTINTTNVFATPDEFFTVKIINIVIEISLFTPKGIKIIIQWLLR